MSSPVCRRNNGRKNNREEGKKRAKCEHIVCILSGTSAGFVEMANFPMLLSHILR
jgi:hypothetical protein